MINLAQLTLAAGRRMAVDRQTVVTNDGHQRRCPPRPQADDDLLTGEAYR
ncbi:hypothetical protein [Micromonospora sp. NPDC093277]